MSLSTTLQLASNSLNAAQIGLQVVGQNIANANTPGYVREDVNYVPAPTQRIGTLTMGMGVQVNGIVQNIDSLLEQRLRGAVSDQASADTQAQAYQQLESFTSELNNTGLAKSLSDFTASMSDVLNQPEDVSVRNLAMLKGQTLSSDINQLTNRIDEVRTGLSSQISSAVNDINRLSRQIAGLNVKIAVAEAGDHIKNVAVGLRDQRGVALKDLAKLVDINVQEQPDGGVAIYTGGGFLVYADQARTIELSQTIAGDSLRFTDTGSLFNVSSGQVTGLLNARDQIVGGFQSQLDDFARTLAFEFNKLHSSGQGLNGYQTVTSQSNVLDANAPLDAAGLSYPIVNGSFKMQLYNKTTKLTQTTNITVDLNGLDHDTTLTDVTAQLNAISGVSASIDVNGHLTIKSTAADQDLAFANDSSGFLASMGINTFFTGTNARTLGVNQEIVKDPAKIAVSRGGVGADTDNGVDLAGFLNRPLDSQNNNTIMQLHDRIIGETTQGSSEAQSVASGLQVFQTSLQSQSLAVSGVNIDEEAVKMLTFQSSFQASAKVIATIKELMDVLIQL
jgi:flagellar hook-associated protein 1 FlgK